MASGQLGSGWGWVGSCFEGTCWVGFSGKWFPYERWWLSAPRPAPCPSPWPYPPASSSRCQTSCSRYATSCYPCYSSCCSCCINQLSRQTVGYQNSTTGGSTVKDRGGHPLPFLGLLSASRSFVVVRLSTVKLYSHQPQQDRMLPSAVLSAADWGWFTRAKLILGSLSQFFLNTPEFKR